MRDGCLESVETIVERQYGVLAERNCESLLFGAEHRRVRSSDDVSGLGAAVKYLSHRASRNVGSDCLIPRHSGTTHLALQLRSPFYVGSAGFGLMCASPDGPCDDVGGPDASLRKTNSDAPDFLN